MKVAATVDPVERRLEEALAANRTAPSAEREQALIDLRLAAYRGGEWPAPRLGAIDEPPALQRAGLPEIAADELDARWLCDGIQGAGGLVVRGLLSSAWVGKLRDAIDRAFEARRAAATDQGSHDARWYGRTSSVKGAPQQFGTKASNSERASGSLWAVDSPATAFILCELYRELGLPGLLDAYFGEAATLSVKKWVLRKVEPKPDRQAGWHQDGRFLGQGIRTVNLWIALSDCGEGTDAPGMELLGGREPCIHPTGTDGAYFDWTVGPGLVDRLAERRPRLYPRFAPGDALLFDHYSLHRTGAGSRDAAVRYAVESWFFAASTAPARQQPLVL